MKCPKCGYLGFETSERCRNCGYDFSLTVDAAGGDELPLHSADGAGHPLADIELGNPRPTSDTPNLDLNRVIGGDEPRATPSRRKGANAPAPAPATRAAAGDDDVNALPLFTAHDDDPPLITKPRPARPPLSVRRTTPEIPRTRMRVVTPRPEDGELSFPSEHASDQVPGARAAAASPGALAGPPAATAASRVIASLVDLGLLALIDGAVIYLTLALAGLSFDQAWLLPLVPLVTFLLLLDGGYLVVFVAAGGQTIGKMLAGIRVVGDDGGRVEIPGALLRALGCGVSAMTAGLGYLPAFVAADRRALHDRLAGTRVVSAR